MSLDNALKIAEGMGDWLVDQTIEICKIPAPGFEEKERADYVAARMKEFGLSDVHVDQAYNAVGVLKGKGGPAVLFAAHIDTVFPRSQPLDIRREPGKVWAPGIRDNSSGTAGMLGLIKVLEETGFQPKGDLIFAGTSGEEGLGDLKGIKQAMKDYGSRASMVICVDGDLGGLTHMGVGSRRLRVTIHATGGHSYGAFGAPSAIHSMGRMIARMADVKVPKDPKTTYNVGVVSGGHSVNSIATEAWMLVDMRSEGIAALAALEKQVHEIVSSVCASDSVKAGIQVVGDRPAGGIPKDHPLVKTVEGVQARLGLKSRERAGSTDANVPLNMGIPAVCIGVTTGGNSHRPDEWLDEAPFVTGLKQLIMVVAEVAG